MDKIYRDAKDVPVVSVLVYADVWDAGVAYHDKELTIPFTPYELKEAYLKGCLIVDPVTDLTTLTFYNPIRFKFIEQPSFSPQLTIYAFDDDETWGTRTITTSEGLPEEETT